ncbi:MAG: Ig-like domain-containing protein, partial [Muribaculaceae bacterium]|nr:Ig-like domain-containing protein [Muribaculaceae bacterium]
ETKTGSRKLDNSYLKYIGGNNVSTEKERFKVIVWYTMSPDDRGDYIKWNLNMPLGENAPVKYIGMQKLNTQQFEFEFEVNAAGEANVEFTIENPKADDPSLSEEDKEFYEKYRKQTLTAYINVIDRNSVEVESVVFVDGPDPLEANVIETQETSAGSVPLYTFVLPEESAGLWPSIFTLECKDGAVATVEQIRFDEYGEEKPATLNITHAGTIIVTATSKDKTATLEITAKLRIDQIAQGDKLQLQTSKIEYAPGETDKIKTTLRSSYKVNDDEYTWVSSNPKVVSVDAYGNITAVSDGSATITVSITDAFGYTATATKEVSVRSVNADANLDDAKWDEYYVIDLGEGGIYYIDTEEGSSDLFVLSLDDELSGNGVYTAGWDFEGTIQFPTNDIFDIVGGTITISGGKWTFDLQVSNGTISGTVTGTKEYMFFEW